MPITVAKGLVKRIVEYPGSISVQVRNADDPQAAAAALRKAVDDIKRLGLDRFSEGGDALTPNYVGGVVEIPSGPFITMVDAPSVPSDEVARIPDIVARHLAEAGVANAVIAPTVRSDALDTMDHTPRLVMLRLYPPHLRGPLETPVRPWHWVEEAWRWLAGAVGPGTVHVSTAGAVFPMPAPQVGPFLERYRERGSFLLVGGDLGSRAWAVNASINVAWGFGGPHAGDEEMVAMAESFTEVARRLAPEVAQAYVAMEDRMASVTGFRHGTDWYGLGGEDPISVESFSDQLCFEAFPYQVLSPGHLERLRANAAAGPLLRPLEGGRAELAVGELGGWLPASPDRRRLRDEGRALLAPCLLRYGESSVMIQEARRRSAEGRNDR